MRMKKWGPLVSIALTLVLLFSLGGRALAATSQDITVTYTPAYVSINITNPTWGINSLTGDSLIRADTIYYANPGGDTVAPSATVTDGESRFVIGNEGSVAVDLTVNWPNFTGGSDPMDNSDTGANGVGAFGAYSYWSGIAFSSKVIAKSAASDLAYNALAASTSVKFGLQFESQSDIITGATESTATITVSAVED